MSCDIGFIGTIQSSDIGFIGTINPIDLGFQGDMPESIGFQGNIGEEIIVVPQGNVTQATLVGGIITLSVSSEPIGLGFQGHLHTSDIGFIGTIDNSDIGFQGHICNC